MPKNDTVEDLEDDRDQDNLQAKHNHQKQKETSKLHEERKHQRGTRTQIDGKEKNNSRKTIVKRSHIGTLDRSNRKWIQLETKKNNHEI